MRTNFEYRAAAREKLSDRWNEVAVMGAIVVGLSILVNVVPDVALDEILSAWGKLTLSGLGTVVAVLLLAPLEYAMYNTLLMVVRNEETGSLVEKMWSLFKGNYDRYVVAMVLETLVIVGLSLITFGIAGIIFAYAYKMVPYLLHDYPDLKPKEALKLSREMMRGSKWDLFVLDLSFIGWIVLGVLSMGILLFWITPYIATAEAEFYNDLKNEAIVEEEA